MREGGRLSKGRRLLVAAAFLAAAAAVAQSATASADTGSGASKPSIAGADASQRAQVGAIYFDGWSGTPGNFHFGGLLGTPYSGRRPLSGWSDYPRDAITAQLRWARAAGISFFVFDWYHNPHPGNGPINMAFDTYWKLQDTAGVGAAIAYVNQDSFVVPREEWPTVVNTWVTQYFARPSYARIAGRPLFVILDEAGFIRQWGGSAGANGAIAALRTAARARGLPGVFVVGGRYLDWFTEQCYPHCIDTDVHYGSMDYDAIAEYTYPMIVEPRTGGRPYADAVAAYKRLLDVTAARGPFKHIPSIMAGFDPRPMILAGQVSPGGGWPLLNGHEAWFTRSPSDVGAFVRDAIAWVEGHASMRIDAQPVVLIQAWNELQEGAFVLPTDADGFGYLRAIAEAQGIPWVPPPEHVLRVSRADGATITSTPSGIRCPPTCSGRFTEGFEVTLKPDVRPGFVFDRWIGCTPDSSGSCSLVLVQDRVAGARTGRADQRRTLSLSLVGSLSARGRLVAIDGYAACVAEEPVHIQRRRAAVWATVAKGTTMASGRYSIALPARGGTYRAVVRRSTLAGRTCHAAMSRPVIVGSAR